MRFVFAIFLLVLPLGASAQRVPDEQTVLAAILDSESEFYYPSIAIRYEAGDTTLTVDHYYFLYYGFAYQDEYKPLDPNPEIDNIMMILERTPVPGVEDAEMILYSANKAFETDPFSPRNINFMTYAYGVLNDTVNEIISADRLYKLLAAMRLSGDGLTEDTPVHVLSFSHVNDFLGAKGLIATKRTVVSRDVEYVELLERDGKTKGYYFDFSRVYWNTPEGPQKRSEGFKFKNLEPKYKIR